MSHLFPEKITVWLSNDSISFIRTRRKKSEPNECVLVMPFDQTESDESFDGALIKFKEKHLGAARFSLILSNAFVQYLLLESQEEIQTMAEEAVYVEFKYREVFDQFSSDMSFSWDVGLNSRSVLSSAVSTKLLSSLQGCFKRHGLQLESVQPYLMVFFNQLLTKFPKHKNRIILLEGGQYIYVEILDGQWVRVHQRYCPEDWESQVEVFIQRENLLSKSDFNNSKIHVFSSSQSIYVSQSLANVLVLPPESLLLKNKNLDLTI